MSPFVSSAHSPSAPEVEPRIVTRFVYVLRLANDGYYVGCTRHLRRRLERHVRSGGAWATVECRPVEIVQLLRFDFPCGNDLPIHDHFERYVAHQWMRKVGPSRVRGGDHGGSWCVRSNPRRNPKIWESVRFFASYAGRRFLDTVVELPATAILSPAEIDLVFNHLGREPKPVVRHRHSTARRVIDRWVREAQTRQDRGEELPPSPYTAENGLGLFRASGRSESRSPPDIRSHSLPQAA